MSEERTLQWNRLVLRTPLVSRTLVIEFDMADIETHRSEKKTWQIPTLIHVLDDDRRKINIHI